MSITDWPVDDRPREKLMRAGVGALSDAELLAIFLRVGVQGKSAVDLAQDLIAHFGSLARLFAASESELTDIKGMGSAKYAQLQAVFEMSRRALADHASQNTIIDHLEHLQTLLQLHFKDATHEQCCALLLDPSLRLIRIMPIGSGSTMRMELNVRQLAQYAFQYNAHALILAHNHPDGTATPSDQDIETTRALQIQLQPLDIRLLDHFIVADGQPAYSMAAHGHLINL